jgi:hypothetical protein
MTASAKQRRDLWTREDEKRLQQLVLANESPFQIAAKLGRTELAVKARAHLLGLTLARFRHQKAWLVELGLKAKKT